MDVELGVLSAEVNRTKSKYPDVKCFDTTRGRFKAIISAVKWADIIVVGGGELVQDVSSLFYTPFNLFPLFLALLFRKKSFAWAIGIGQKNELAFCTPILLKLALWKSSGITLRDRGSYNVLYKLGFREPQIKLTADCALTLPVEKFASFSSSILGIAPRNVSNRQRKLLPLELRKKMKNYVEPDPRPVAKKWVELLDLFCKDNKVEQVVLFPFHTGSLSNDDLAFCKLIQGMAKSEVGIEIADISLPLEFLKKITDCRVLVSSPLHGLIMAFVSGTIPVAVSYSSKCTRFMELAELESLASDEKVCVPTKSVQKTLEYAWNNSEKIKKQMLNVSAKLVNRAQKTEENFRKVFGV